MWKPIPEFPEYEASDSGRIRNRKTLRVREPGARNCNGKGYYITPMLVKGRYIARPVHRLIAQAFLGTCPPGLEVNHKNGDKLDNRAENLEYVTHKENMGHHFRTRTKPDPRERFTEKDIKEILVALSSDRTQQSLAKEYGVTQTVISRIARGKSYKWIKIR